MNTYPAILALEDGSIFRGQAIGAKGETVGEVVFNTAMSGYQEILTDPSYAQQIVTLTYPHVGNVGTNFEDQESAQIMAAGLIIRDLPVLASNWRSQQTLQDYLISQNIVAIAEVDTRRLTRLLRDKGTQRGCILTADNEEKALAALNKFSGMQGLDLAKEVTTKKIYPWCEGSWQLNNGYQQIDPAQQQYHVVAYDFGIKHNILRLLVDRGCKITVVPAKTDSKDVMDLQPDGVFLSNGPGDPEPCDYAIKAIKDFLQKDVPMFGICLGHQLLGLACGAKSIKMKFGHHGANHPVQDLQTDQVLITSQNHGFAIDESTLPAAVVPTHRSLFDGSLQGIQYQGKPVFGFQGHPEASPGPHDITYLFDKFIDYMRSSSGKH